MLTRFKLRGLFLALSMAGAAALLGGCGGGNDVAAPVAATTTPLSATVIDGAIHKALVCLDKNANGACLATHPHHRHHWHFCPGTLRPCGLRRR